MVPTYFESTNLRSRSASSFLISFCATSMPHSFFCKASPLFPSSSTCLINSATFLFCAFFSKVSRDSFSSASSALRNASATLPFVAIIRCSAVTAASRAFSRSLRIVSAMALLSAASLSFAASSSLNRVILSARAAVEESAFTCDCCMAATAAVAASTSICSFTSRSSTFSTCRFNESNISWPALVSSFALSSSASKYWTLGCKALSL
mmetsp:Transcript_24270/g.43475  ORF Transcript_24270/g.43475 Transcript_24270/m.43475 type:complete len:208 (+) Transcript_24270:158-781(+)